VTTAMLRASGSTLLHGGGTLTDTIAMDEMGLFAVRSARVRDMQTRLEPN
jgi:hypothetical protein